MDVDHDVIRVEHDDTVAGLQRHGPQRLNDRFRGKPLLGPSADFLGLRPNEHSIWTKSARLGYQGDSLGKHPLHSEVTGYQTCACRG